MGRKSKVSHKGNRGAAHQGMNHVDKNVDDSLESGERDASTSHGKREADEM